MQTMEKQMRPTVAQHTERWLSHRSKKKILLIGNTQLTAEMAENINKLAQDYCVVGCMRLNSRERLRLSPKPSVHVFGDLSEMQIFLDLVPMKVNVILLTDPEIRYHQVLRIMELARKHRVEIWGIPHLHNAFMGDLKFFNFFGHPVIKIDDNRVKRHRMVLKALFDYAAALMGLILCAPVMLAAAVLIKLTSPGPILYRQVRVGRHGRTFQMIKFRSIRANAESGIGPVLSPPNDNRVTPIGAFLRKTHIDEFPQFINVLKGEMSMVGPRPERPFFVETYSRYIPFYNDRFLLKPGVTGMAQVYGNYHSKAEEKLIFDLNYLHNFNLWLDFKVCLHTAFGAIRSVWSR